jgi:hypothetical protein
MFPCVVGKFKPMLKGHTASCAGAKPLTLATAIHKRPGPSPEGRGER